LIFDEQLQLCGRRFVREEKVEMVRAVQHKEEAAFTGIHVISPELIPLFTEAGTFSIIASYLRLAEAGEKIVGFRADGYTWRDLGRPEDVEAARAEVG
jgi:NDP-sugar pyrophosphorylase family protein